MTLRSELSGRLGLSGKSGVTLLEMLIVLTISALVVGVVAASLRPPPRDLRERRTLATLETAGLQVRLRAIRSGAAQTWSPSGPFCAGQSGVAVVYMPDGSAYGAAFCLRVEGADMWVAPDPVTGRLRRRDGPVP